MAFLPYSIRGEDDSDDDVFNPKVPASIRECHESLMESVKAFHNTYSGNSTVEVDRTVDDQSNADVPMDYSSLIAENAFIGEVPFEVIIEGMTDQFRNYMSTEDKTNYVDIFYNQLHASYDAVNSDDGEEHPTEITEVIDGIYQTFLNTVADLFNLCLAITVLGLDGDDLSDSEDYEFIIRKLYEFFILDAKVNFKVAIASDIISRLDGNIIDDNEFFGTINNMMGKYTPLITGFGPDKFLQYRKNQEVIDLFENGDVVGNFLRKYTPKLYQHEEFQVELINYIVMLLAFKEDMSSMGDV